MSLAALPEPARSTLRKLRRIIKPGAPGAEEVISYRMPMFKYHGPLVGLAAFSHHCSFFTMSPKVMAKHRVELKSYETAPGTIRFPADKPLPAALVRKIVKARIEENDARMKARAKPSRAKSPLKRKGST